MKSVLHIAAEEGHVDIVRTLLSQKTIEVDVRCLVSATPLSLYSVSYPTLDSAHSSYASTIRLHYISQPLKVIWMW